MEAYIGAIIAGVVGLGFWYIKGRLNKIEEMDIRLTQMETKWDILGDIHQTLSNIRLDIELIKSKIK